jgi:signal peptidase I
MRPVDDLAAQVLRRGAPLRIKARGGSMLPFMWDGDVALVTPAGATKIRVGDIVCYELPGRLFLHRVIDRDGDGFVAKGDALRFTDVIDRRQLLGRVVAIERSGRITRLDTRAARWRSIVIAFFSPLLPHLVSAAMWARRTWRALV